MSNTITKATAFDYSTTNIGFPGIPAQPQRRWFANEQRCQFVVVGPGVSYDWVQPVQTLPGLPNAPAEWTPSLPAGTGFYNTQSQPQNVWRCQWLDRPVLTAAAVAVRPYGRVVPTPTRTIFDFNLGWNAGTRSIKSMVGDAMMSFNALKPVGAVVGFNNTDSYGNYANITQAWVFANNVAQIFINGKLAYNAGAYASTDVFAIRRVRGNVEFLKNGVNQIVFFPIIGTSPPLNTTNGMTGTIFLDTSLFAGGDSIDNPVYTDLSTVSAIAQPMRSVGGGVTYRYANTRMRLMTCSSGVLSRVTSVSATMRTQASNYKLGQGIAVGKKLTVSSFTAIPAAAYGLGVPAYAICGVNFVQPTTWATGLTGQIGQVLNSRMLPMRTRGGKIPQSTVQASGATMTSYASAFDGPLVGRMGTLNIVQENWVAANYLVVTMTSAGAFTSAFSYGFQILATLLSQLTTTTSMPVQAVLLATMNSILKAGFTTPITGDANQVWVINTDTMAVSMYEAFPFNSFARVGQQSYGAKTDGVYLLEGDNDQGTAITASINMGRQNFGSLSMKKMPNLYVGVSSTGLMILKVTTPQGAYFYTAKNSSSDMKVQRVDVGKGLRAAYYQLELFNQAGADFSLDEIEFRAVVAETRKIQ